MAEIASIFLSPLIQAFFNKMASGEFVDFFRQQKLSEELLKELERTYLTVSAVLEDTEELQVTKPAVKRWLDELKDAVYDAEHVLDEIVTEALRSELEAQFQTTSSKVRKSISAFRNSFVEKIELKIKEVLGILESLAQQKNIIGLTEGGGGKSSEIFATSSLVEESDIYGRNEEKEAIIDLLLSDDACGNKMGVIAIVGMGGIGKTTLAQLVYNDKRVKEFFNLDAWVYVSNEVDVTKVTKKIMEGLSLPTRDITDLNRLQITLKRELTAKKFLIVLDDVWNENYVNWEHLSKPFKFGAQGSKVIVTTRDHEVALVMHASSTHPLKKLPEEDCRLLFTKHAFHDGNPNAHPQLEELGRQIVEKCDGLPLAVKAIGDLLRYKLDVDKWNKILNSELWDSPIDKTEILPALRLSYKYLPPHLKRCFAYCSIFPKDYVFPKNKLILLWMAEGFLHESKSMTMEEVGDDYFSALVSRSLFQQSSGNKSLFTMHHLVNSLATFVSGQFTVRMEGDYSKEIVNKVRHLSYVREEFDGFKKFKALYKAKKLCTFLPMDLSWSCFSYLTKKVPHELLPMLKCLRVLSLSLYRNMIELPDSIGKLTHLRYLDLSSTRIQKLPDSICKLCNLQTLILSQCEMLTALPSDMWKLVSLRHLDITDTRITEMPIQIGRLKYLQTLTKFIVGKGSGLCIGELRTLVNLRGSLSILELQNVESHTDALDTSLRDKKYLEELVLEWEYANNFSESQKIVLDGLQPPTNLKSLTIKYYGGRSLSDWIGYPSFSKLTSLHLEECNYCSSLPPLGQLPSLQNLSIVGFDEVVKVGPEFCGCGGSSSVNSFGALKVLTFEGMGKWEEWVSFGTENGGLAFPQLEELYIKDCPKLKGGLPIHLSSLAKLQICNCWQLVAPLPKTPAIRELKLTNCDEKLLQELPTGMQKLVIEGFDEPESIPEGTIESIDRLQKLEIVNCSLTSLRLPSTLKTISIRNCDSLESLLEGTTDSNNGLQELRIACCYSLEGGFPSTLKTLDIYNCRTFDLPTHLPYSSLETLSLCHCWILDSFPLDLFPKLYQLNLWECHSLENLTVPENYEHNLVTLQIKDCPNFVSFPNGGLRAPSLTSLSIIDCRSLRSLPEEMRTLLPSLEVLLVSECREIESIPDGGLPSNLKSVEIDRCDKLIASRMGWGLQNLSILTALSIDGRRHEYEESFPILACLSIGAKHRDVESFPKARLLPTSLTYLSISDFPRLKSLDKRGLQHLRNLQVLKISNCPKLKYMPDKGLPASLSILKISNCPLLTKQWQGTTGKEWSKIAHVEQIWIDGDLIE